MQAENVNLITIDSRFEGTVEFSNFTRFEGCLQGTLRGLPGSQIILGEDSVVEGRIEADTIIIDGFVRGDIQATAKVVVSETGRVIGKISAPSIAIKFGAYFDGSCEMSPLLPAI